MKVLNGWTDFRSQIWESLKLTFTNLGNYWLKGSDTQAPFLSSFIFALIVLIIGIILIKIINRLIKKAMKIDKAILKDRNAKSFVASTINILLYVILFFIICGILRINLQGASEILATGVLAIGIALQNVISNFASGIIILSTKPFVADDYISINDQIEGTVKEVKFLTTTLLTYRGQIVTIPNTNITSNHITNYTRYPLRRGNIDVRIDYSEDLDRVRSIMLEAIKGDTRIFLEPAPYAVVDGFDSNSVGVSMRFWVSYSEYWDVMFDSNAKLAKLFKENNVKVAYKQLVITERNKYQEGEMYK